MPKLPTFSESFIQYIQLTLPVDLYRVRTHLYTYSKENDCNEHQGHVHTEALNQETTINNKSKLCNSSTNTTTTMEIDNKDICACTDSGETAHNNTWKHQRHAYLHLDCECSLWPLGSTTSSNFIQQKLLTVKGASLCLVSGYSKE